MLWYPVWFLALSMHKVFAQVAADDDDNSDPPPRLSTRTNSEFTGSLITTDPSLISTDSVSNTESSSQPSPSAPSQASPSEQPSGPDVSPITTDTSTVWSYSYSLLKTETTISEETTTYTASVTYTNVIVTPVTTDVVVKYESHSRSEFTSYYNTTYEYPCTSTSADTVYTSVYTTSSPTATVQTSGVVTSVSYSTDITTAVDYITSLATIVVISHHDEKHAGEPITTIAETTRSCSALPTTNQVTTLGTPGVSVETNVVTHTYSSTSNYNTTLLSRPWSTTTIFPTNYNSTDMVTVEIFEPCSIETQTYTVIPHTEVETNYITHTVDPVHTLEPVTPTVYCAPETVTVVFGCQQQGVCSDVTTTMTETYVRTQTVLKTVVSPVTYVQTVQDGALTEYGTSTVTLTLTNDVPVIVTKTGTCTGTTATAQVVTEDIVYTVTVPEKTTYLSTMYSYSVSEAVGTAVESRTYTRVVPLQSFEPSTGGSNHLLAAHEYQGIGVSVQVLVTFAAMFSIMVFV
ncbi:HER198Wp [Eremothecium sinecaudum]|uniref:HER198Wp n=1 Tax=Eremothecium sinecaudum TaxID=45286 RepID=A0A0X8HU31_9SACH|nr:HER198Wp [Eremothecium sinecaudum]AMD21477.1 HER198Wp [Eremothecium sinecaudum]